MVRLCSRIGRKIMATKDIIQAAAGVGGGDRLYVEDVFSTYLYTGTGSTQTITNGIDLAGEGGLVWLKSRSLAEANQLFDTDRGVENRLFTNTTGAQNTGTGTLTSFNSDGFSIGSNNISNTSGSTNASWTFRKAEKFFDVVTYTGNGVWDRAIPHNLGSSPGFVVIKRTDATANWVAQHRTNTEKNSKILYLNDTTAYSLEGDNFFSRSDCFTSTDVYIGANANVNANNGTYVMYLFAHNAGGFGEDGTENVISCGSITTNGSTNQTVTLGYEPQWILIKKTTGVGGWILVDNMRGIPSGQNESYVLANLSNIEASSINTVELTPTGFITQSSLTNVSATWIYIAIRRGPMKTPTSGTEVYNAISRTGTGTTTTVTGAGFPVVDLVIAKSRFNTSFGWDWLDRLRGADRNLFSNATDAEYSNSTYPSLTSFATMDGVILGNDQWNGYINYNSSNTYINYFLRRAPGFFDVVCYTGNGSTQLVKHNLGVVPDLMFLKGRSTTINWSCGGNVFPNPAQDYLIPNLNNAKNNNTIIWNNTAPTSTEVSLGAATGPNSNGASQIAYLFASCPGVSKVGSYTGNASTNQIDCGFSSGARFVLIKRTDSTGDWYVWDSARGIVAGNDPYLLLNSTAAEVTTTDYIDPYSAGFEISSTAPAGINANGGSYIFLAIA